MANSFLEKGEKCIRVHDGLTGAVMALLCELAKNRTDDLSTLDLLSRWKASALQSPPGLIDFDLSGVSSSNSLGRFVISLLVELRHSLSERVGDIPSSELRSAAGENSWVEFGDIAPANLIGLLDRLIHFFESL